MVRISIVKPDSDRDVSLQRDSNRARADAKKTNKGFWSRKFVEFCNRTDLHGYKYIVMSDLNIAERSCWAILVASSIVCAGYFVSTAYRWFSKNPVVTVIETTQAPVWELPFPAVTVCNLNIVSIKAARAFAQNLTLPANVTTEYVFEILRLVPLLPSTLLASVEQIRKLTELQTILNKNNISVETLFRKISPVASCNDMFQHCRWKDRMYRCDKLFQEVFVAVSLCCSFNYFAIDSGAKASDFVQFNNPRRVSSCGYKTALTVSMNSDFEDYYSTSVGSQGHLVFVDDAFNIPNQNTPVRLVNPFTEVLIALTPESIYSVPGVRSFTPDQRQCYFKDEIKIGKFNQYSFHNCLTLQLALTIKHLCQCVPFFVPFKEYYRSCDFNDISCLELLMSNSAPGDSGFISNVSCLPDCDHYENLYEVAVGQLSEKHKIIHDPFYNDVNSENRSILNVFYNDLVTIQYRRDVYYNWQNLLAAFGGLLSLVLGFTLISGFDLVLFVILHIIYDGARVILRRKSNSKNKIHVADIKKSDEATEKHMHRARNWQNVEQRENNVFKNRKY